MLDTAAWADHAGGASEVGRGDMRRCRALYANAEVDDAVDSYLCACLGRKALHGRAARRDNERIAFREAMITAEVLGLPQAFELFRSGWNFPRSFN